MTEPIENLYFNWLCAKAIRVDHPTPSLTYYKLFKQLHDTEYAWLLSGDDNRAEDGVELRTEFLTEACIPLSGERWESIGCSVLEMLIAFSRRAEFNAGESVQFWFWHMLDNLGLAQANDASDMPAEDIDEILHIFIWRLYDECGNGGLFPVEFTENNQREVEIWYQFCEYLVDIDWPL